MILFLVGYAGSGKSSLGKRLQRALGLRLVDTDKLVERSEGATVADIFYYQGEEYFRCAERDVIESLVADDFEGIVATGGGLAVWRDNMERMNRVGTTIYLRRSPEQILSRLTEYGRNKRPMFRGKSDEELLAFMHEQLALREPFYERAELVIDCNRISDEEVVERIIEYIKA